MGLCGCSLSTLVQMPGPVDSLTASVHAGPTAACLYPTEWVSIAGNTVNMSHLLSSWLSYEQQAGTVTLLSCLRYKFHCWLSPCWARPCLVWYRPSQEQVSMDNANSGMSMGTLWGSENHVSFDTGHFWKQQEAMFDLLRNGSHFFPCPTDWCMEKEQKRQIFSVFNIGMSSVTLMEMIALLDICSVQGLVNFSTWAMGDRKVAQTQARNPHLWKSIADNPWQHWLSFLLVLVPEFKIYILLILWYYYLFSRPLHMLASLKLKYSPCLGKGNVICESHSDTYFIYVTSWGLWVLDLGFSCLIPLWVFMAESAEKVTAYTVPCVYLPVPQSTR